MVCSFFISKAFSGSHGEERGGNAVGRPRLMGINEWPSNYISELTPIVHPRLIVAPHFGHFML